VSKRFSIRNKVADACSGYTVVIDNGETYAVLWLKKFFKIGHSKIVYFNGETMHIYYYACRRPNNACEQKK
jgi:hypothetical protein